MLSQVATQSMWSKKCFNGQVWQKLMSVVNAYSTWRSASSKRRLFTMALIFTTLPSLGISSNMPFIILIINSCRSNRFSFCEEKRHQNKLGFRIDCICLSMSAQYCLKCPNVILHDNITPKYHQFQLLWILGQEASVFGPAFTTSTLPVE